MKLSKKRQKGQAMVEYIIIVVVVAIAALAIFGAFGQRLMQVVKGATSSISSDAQNPASDIDTSTNTQDVIKGMTDEGLGDE